MRTIKQLPVPQDQDPKFPFGTIQNENEDGTVLGTPVVREIYGDILTNFYAILRDAGIVPNGTEDNDDNGYQFLEALKKFTNNLNDIEQVLSLTASDFSINLDIDNLPNKYVIFARTASAYTSGVSYTFSGTGNNSYPLTSPTGFKASDEVMIVIDTAGVRVYSVTFKETQSPNIIFSDFGSAISFNDSDKIYYGAEGKLFTDDPAIFDIQNAIRLNQSNASIYVNEIFILKSKVLSFCFDTSTEDYSFFDFDLNDLNNPTEVSLSGVTIPNSTSDIPYVFTDGESVYISNNSGNSANPYELDKLAYDESLSELNFIQNIVLDDSFVKTTNTVIKGDHIYTFVSGNLRKYALSGSTVIDLGTFPSILGQIFNLKNEIYYSNGEVAKKWEL